MRAVLARNLRLYPARSGGAVPRRVVVHKLTPFREEGLLGVDDALEISPFLRGAASPPAVHDTAANRRRVTDV